MTITTIERVLQTHAGSKSTTKAALHLAILAIVQTARMPISIAQTTPRRSCLMMTQVQEGMRLHTNVPGAVGAVEIEAAHRSGTASLLQDPEMNTPQDLLRNASPPLPNHLDRMMLRSRYLYRSTLATQPMV